MARFVAFLVSLLIVLPVANGQVGVVNNTTSTPIFGAGHDYIQALSEIVNPANGSVSVRVAAPVPPARGLTTPRFLFNYDSTTPFGGSTKVLQPVITTTCNNGVCTSQLNSVYWFQPPFTPPTSFQNIVLSAQPQSGGPTFHCNYNTGYVYTDPLGQKHALNLLFITYDSPTTSCNFFNVFPTSVGGDSHYKALLSVSGALYITDAHGTLADYEDSNGNAAIGGSANAPTDTSGRTVYSQSGNSVTYSGIPTPFTYTPGTSSWNYGVNATLLGSQSVGPCATFFAANTGSASVTNAITLPTTQKYQFAYEPVHGLLNKITYPTGATVTYTWNVNSQSEAIAFGNSSSLNCEYRYDGFAITKRVVSFDGTTPALEQDFSYSTTWNGSTASWTNKQTIVTTHDLLRPGQPTFQTIYNYTSVGVPRQPGDYTLFSGQMPVESSIVYKDTSGATLRTVMKNWIDFTLLASECVMLDSGATSGTFYTYAQWNNNTSSIDEVTDKKEYDFGQVASGTCQQPSATPTRETVTVYQSFPNTPLFPGYQSLLDRPSSVKVYDHGTLIAETDYAYDETPVTGLSSLTGHDETHYPASYNNRGNLTTKTVKCLQTGCPNAVTKHSYDETGQVLTMTDPCGNASCADMTGTSHITNYSYTDTYTILSGGQNVNYTPSANTNTYLTTTTDPLGHTQNFTYDYNTGQLTVAKDANGQSTAYLYNDPLARPTRANYPDTGLTQYFYTDAVGNVNVEKKKSIDGTSTTDEFSYYDGMGHQISHSTANGESVPWDKTDACFDGLGRQRFASYPYQASSALPAGGCPSEAGNSFGYDARSRVTSVTHSDNSVVTTSYVGRATDVLDEGNGVRRAERVSQVDGLGRLVSVCEVTSSTQLGPGGTPAACGQDIAKTGFLTSYGYDGLSNLLTVTQGALAQRSFTYDSLSRLLTATNPESGTTCYGTWSNNQCVNGYDANSNMAYRTRSAPNQTNPATTVTTSYRYDPLDRVINRSYSDGVTPAASFIYDQTGTITIAGQAYPISNSIGRLTSNCTGPTTGCLTEFAFSYDKVGRVNQQEEFINGWSGASELSYNYDLIGDETTDIALGNNSTYNVAGRLTTFTHPNYNGPGEPANLLTNAHYDAYGHMISGAFGDGLSQSWAYDPRGRVQSAAVGTNCSGGSCSGSTVYRYTVGYAPNSSVSSSTDTVNGTWTYTADDLNRLASSSCTANCPNNSSSQSFTYMYDRYSNRWQQNAPQGGPQSIYTFTGGNNRADGLSYDAVGNLRNDGNHSYIYDAENRIVSVDNGAATYVYDIEGRRVQQIIGSQTCSHWYDQKGRVVIRTSAVGATCATFQRYDYVGNMLLGTYTNYAANQNIAPFFYAHGDWVGTERARVDSTTGAACQTVVSLPFGDGQTVKGNCGTATSDMDFHHFTGKARDTESNLDYFGARHYASSMGRFMTPDQAADETIPVPLPWADFRNPQSVNLYGYALNNPVSNVDPDGHDVHVCVDNSSGGQNCFNMSDQQYADLQKQQNGQNGINMPGGSMPGGNITCGGQVCGSASYFEPGLQDTSLDVAMFVGGVASLARGLIEGGLGLLRGAGEAGAGTAAREAGVALAEQAVVKGGKAAIRDALENGAVNELQKQAVKRALARGAASDTFTLAKLADGSIKVSTEVAGRAGGRAVYEKVIDAAGRTTSVVQRAYDASGALTHVDPKFP